jgi:hypothetical protein
MRGEERGRLSSAKKQIMVLIAFRIHRIAKTEGQLFKRKCLNKYTIVCNELTNCMKITELRNLCTVLCKMQCQWHDKTKK